MNLFLLIHTSLDKAFVALAEDDVILFVERNDTPREHGAFLHVAIGNLIRRGGIEYKDLTAIGVTHGPGSYTGIRVGLSAAKGLAFALNIPLVLCSTLAALAATAAGKLKKNSGMYVPMIQARQTEYYVGKYDYLLNNLEADSLVVFGEGNVGLFQDKDQIVFGIRLEAFSEISGILPQYAIDEIDEKSFAGMVHRSYQNGDVTDAGDAAPLYLKEAFIKS